MNKGKSKGEKENQKPTGQNMEMIMQIRRAKIGANWFFWIAGLSLINTALFYFGGGGYFIAGLGITQVIEGFLSNFGTLGIIISITLNIFISGIFTGLGYFAGKKRMNLAFITGLILYILDTLLFLLVGDILSIIFHIYVLVNIFLGYRANKRFLERDK